MLLTIGVHPAWSEIVENATSNRWSEVLKKTKLGIFDFRSKMIVFEVNLTANGHF